MGGVLPALGSSYFEIDRVCDALPVLERMLAARR
jgi:hypothetical protein